MGQTSQFTCTSEITFFKFVQSFWSFPSTYKKYVSQIFIDLCLFGRYMISLNYQTKNIWGRIKSIIFVDDMDIMYWPLSDFKQLKFEYLNRPFTSNLTNLVKKSKEHFSFVLVKFQNIWTMSTKVVSNKCLNQLIYFHWKALITENRDVISSVMFYVFEWLWVVF